MFVAVRRFTIHDDTLSMDEVTERVRTQLIPEFEAIDGFREYFLIDSKQPSVTSITICDDQAAADQVNSASMAFVKRAFTPGSIERIDLTHGEVLLAPAVIGHM